MPVILRIAVPGNPLRRYFDYLPPADLDPAAAAALAPGCRLRVPRRPCRGSEEVALPPRH